MTNEGHNPWRTKGEPVFVNGKATFDWCIQCGEDKAAIRARQLSKDPLYCGEVDYWGEVTWEADRHKFTLTEKVYTKAIEAERAWFEKHGAEYV